MADSGNRSLNRNEQAFPPISNIPNIVCVHNVQFGNDDQKHNHSHSLISLLCTHTACCSPHQCLPGGSLPERKSAVGAAQFQEPMHQEGICDFWVWDKSGTEVVSVCCVMGVALGDQPTLVGRTQTFKTNLLPSRKAIQWVNPAPCLSLSFCLIFSEGVPICDRLHSCDDYSIVRPLTLMMHRLSKAQLFYNVPKLIPRAFLGRGRELLWHMEKIWWFVWNWSAEFLPPLPPSSLLRSKKQSASHCPIIPKQGIINSTLHLKGLSLMTSVCHTEYDIVKSLETESVAHEFWLME